MDVPLYYPRTWTDAFLDAQRQAGDPEADEVITVVMREPNARAVWGTLATLRGNGDPLPPGLPEVLRKFLERTAVVPAWANEEMIADGQRIFGRYVALATLALNCASLPICYSAAKGAQVLALGERISQDTRKRILETAQFVIDVMTPGAFSLRGRGVRSIQRVRLLHAAMRYHLAKHPGYDPAWGVPACQEDQAGTLGAFSVTITESLEKLGVNLRWYEREAYYHAWKVIGAMLGISPELLPRDHAEMRSLADAIVRRHASPSDAGQLLTAALIKHMEDEIPGKAMDGLAVALVRHLIDEPTAQVLGLPRADWTSMLVGPVKLLSVVSDRIGDHSPTFADAASKLGHIFLRRFHGWQFDGEVDFRIPTSLREHALR